MMASAMWQMMSSMVQQQQCMGSVPGGPGTQEWDAHRQQLLQCYRLGYPELMLRQGFLSHLR